MRFSFQKVFLNTDDETEWLNKMALRGLLLEKRAPLTYYFRFDKDEDKDWRYRVVYMRDAVENGASDEELKALPDDGSVLACGYKNKAYLLKSDGGAFGEYDDSGARVKHYFSIWSFYFFCFIAALAVFSYHIDYAIKMVIESKPIPSPSLIAYASAALLCISFLFAYYFDKTLLWRSVSKKAKAKREIYLP